jgi:pyruvate/2-oxoglutarate dehydrogenase complex dihydrolipoamide acyltransferase (E2) component
MATKVIMPQLGESVVEGTVTKWLKHEGEAVEEFEPLVEINTDKVDTEVPAPASGTLLKLYVDAGETVEAGRLLAMIGKPGEQVPKAPDVGGPSTAKTAPGKPGSAAAPKPVAAGKKSGLGFISPVVAKIAAEHDLDLKLVDGSGRNGRITKKDVLSYLESGGQQAPPPASAPAPWEEPASGELFRPTEEVFKTSTEGAVETDEGLLQPLGPVRKSIAEHMVRSKHTSPHVTTVMQADLSQVVAHRAANRGSFERDGINLTFSAYFAAAAVWALTEMPLVNASWTDEGILMHPHVNLGMAVSLGDKGLIVPVIKAAESRSLRGLAGSINDLAARARRGDLSPDDVQGGTFTITNHGVSGSLMATPIINQPQCGILGVGAIQKRVVVVESKDPAGQPTDSIAIRPMVYLTLTFDHRILDGAIADQFLGLIVGRLQSWS